MTFWITVSIILFLIVIVSVFGPLFGIYGSYEKENMEDDK